MGFARGASQRHNLLREDSEAKELILGKQQDFFFVFLF